MGVVPTCHDTGPFIRVMTIYQEASLKYMSSLIATNTNLNRPTDIRKSNSLDPLDAQERQGLHKRLLELTETQRGNLSLNETTLILPIITKVYVFESPHVYIYTTTLS